jgi:hypothetical protein
MIILNEFENHSPMSQDENKAKKLSITAKFVAKNAKCS